MLELTNIEIVREVWRADREIVPQAFAANIDTIRSHGGHVYEWAGEDRHGRPLTVVWATARRTGWLLAAYELTAYQTAA